MWHSGIDEGSRALTAVITAVFVMLLVRYIFVVHKRRQHLPPGPWPWPVVGNLSALQGLAHRKLQKLAATYGGLMYLQLGEKPCLVLSTVSATKELFRTHDAAFSSRPWRMVQEVLSGGKFRHLPMAPYGHYWRQLRRLANTQLFSPATHASHEGIRNGEVRNMMRLLAEETKTGSTIDLKHWLSALTANNMTMMITNNRFFDIRNKNEEKRAYDDVLRQSFQASGAIIISDYVPSLSFITKWQGWRPHLEDLRRRGLEVVHKVIDVDKHRQRAAGEQGENYVPDFVDVLLTAPLDDDGKPLSDGEIMGLLLSLLNAGTDTSATTAEWAMAELMAHPEILQQAQAELKTVIGEARLVEEADMPNLPYLQAIVKETFRLHPVAPLSVARESHEPCILSGCKFPAKTMLILNIFAIHRDPAIYEAPEIFNPSRFVAHPEVNPVSGHDWFELIPFGAGRRMCPGARLGMTLVSLMLANLLHCFDWSLPEGESAESMDMQEELAFPLYRRHRLLLLASPRRPASLLAEVSQIP